jgi:hypothetical protein
MGMEKKQKIGE